MSSVTCPARSRLDCTRAAQRTLPVSVNCRVPIWHCLPVSAALTLPQPCAIGVAKRSTKRAGRPIQKSHHLAPFPPPLSFECRTARRCQSPVHRWGDARGHGAQTDGCRGAVWSGTVLEARFSSASLALVRGTVPQRLRGPTLRGLTKQILIARCGLHQ